uniref:Acyl-CoA dehydrogenases n=1 Tax=uncultured gamma proteobacterium HF4000_36I10 TaxID=710989 RepID=E0XWG6_9GAMM|nr:acyl-CoA dehydrogenases [uncultured gamma proteobacterium HF4000_36I10]
MTASSYLDTVTDIAQAVIAPQAEATYQNGVWPQAGLKALQQAGLGGLTIPLEYGGLGGGAAGLAAACEIIGRECGSSALCFGMHCVGSSVIAANATKAQVERFLGPICAGEHLTTLALSEPGTGSHFYLPQTQIEAVQGGYRVNGQKTFVTNGNHADSYVLSGVSAGDGMSFSCVVGEHGSAGMSWGGEWQGMGMRGNSSIQLTLSDMQVSQDHLLGNEGDQIWYVFHVVAPYFLVAMAGTYLGLASTALDIACKHLTRRSYSHNGEILADSQVLQHRIGCLWGELAKTRALVHSAAQKFDDGADDALPSVMAAKAEVAGTAVHIVNEAMTLCGGMGYRDGGSLQRLLHDIRAAHVMAPTTDILRTWIGRAILELPLLGD